MVFQSPYIKVDSNGIDLMKNYQTYKQIGFEEIEQIHLRKGYLLEKRVPSLLISSVIIAFSLAYGIYSGIHFELIVPFSSQAYPAVRLFVPWLLFIGGLIWFYQAMRKSPVIDIVTEKNTYQIRLIEFERNNTLNDLITYLESKVKLYKEL